MDLTTSYKVLGLDPQVDEDTAKRAYKAQVRRWHPDQFPDGSSAKAAAEEQLKQINIAYARIKADPSLQRREPASVKPENKPHQSKRETPQTETEHQEKNRRSWMDHLFDTLSAFAGTHTDDSQPESDDQTDPRQKRTFGQVLDEMTGGMPPTSKKQRKSAGQNARRNFAEHYKRYRRPGSSVGGVAPTESKGPVKPVSRVRGIGKSR